MFYSYEGNTPTLPGPLLFPTRILMSEIKKMLMILGLERSGNKGEVVERLMAFMMQPEDIGKKPPAPPKVCHFMLW